MPKASSVRRFLGSLANALFSPGILWAYLYWAAIGAGLFFYGWAHGFKAGQYWVE